MSLKVDHFAFAVKDIDKAVKFYHEVLNLPLLFIDQDEVHGEKFAFLKLEGGNLELLASLDGTPSPAPRPFLNCPHLALNVPDINAFAATLRSHNVPFDGPKTILGKVAWGYFQDPDGNTLEACQWLS